MNKIFFLPIAVGLVWTALPRRPMLPALGTVHAFSGTASDARGAAAFSSSELSGRPWVAGFLYTRCGGPCPALAAVMSGLQDELPENARLVAFTVDPEYDSPERLTDYARKTGARAGRWSLLRVKRRALYDLLYAGFESPVAENTGSLPETRFLHSTKLVLVDGGGTVRGRYDAFDPAARRALSRHAAFLAREAR